MAEEESLIGKTASAIIPGMSGAPDRVVQGTIIRVYIMKWDGSSDLKPFDPYERVEIDFSAPGSGKERTLDTAKADITLVE